MSVTKKVILYFFLFLIFIFISFSFFSPVVFADETIVDIDPSFYSILQMMAEDRNLAVIALDKSILNLFDTVEIVGYQKQALLKELHLLEAYRDFIYTHASVIIEIDRWFPGFFGSCSMDFYILEWKIKLVNESLLEINSIRRMIIFKFIDALIVVTGTFLMIWHYKNG